MAAHISRRRTFTRVTVIMLTGAMLPGADAVPAPPISHSTTEPGHKEERVPPPEPGTTASHAELPRSPARDISFGGLTSVQVNIDTFGNNIVGDAANEPSIAIDPTNPDRIAIGWRQFDTIASNFRQAGVAYSHDGGATWTNVGPLDPGNFRSDPVLGANNNGTFFFMSLSSLSSMELFRSFDGGVTWGSPTPAFGGDKEWMTIDTSGGPGNGNIYAVWNSQFSCCGTAEFTRSIDGGATFATPIDIPDPKLKWGTLDVGPGGELFLAGATLDESGHVFARAPRPFLLRPVTFDLVRPIDLGGTTSPSFEVNPAGILGQVTIAAEQSTLPTSGNIYVLGSVTPSMFDPADVHFVRSTDGGRSFSAPVRINDDSTANGAFQWFGTMSAAPNGRIDVVWLDTRNDATPETPTTSELFHAYSLDAGFTWSPNTILSPPFDHSLGYPMQDKLGDYFDMISDHGGASLAYAATFNGEQDVYFLRIPADCNDNGTPDDEDVLVGGLPDCNGNLIPDSCESTDDCNGDSTPDLCELAAGASVDCNRNLILDECEDAEDCNSNGVQDFCELFDGSAFDCNANEVLDECDITSGLALDCNADGVPDECEVDCNDNGIPDNCDIDAGTSTDLDENGIPDECEVYDPCVPGFSEQNVISTDFPEATRIAAADLDGDGDADALSASWGGLTVAWYENTDGLGTFGPERVITSEARTPAVAIAADVDGDEDMDVIADGSLPDSLVWYENANGLGTSSPRHIITSAADNVLSIFAADVDGDNDIDVLSASRADDKVAWYENVDGLGTFGPQQIISLDAAEPLSVFAADLDGDSDNDVLSASLADGKIAWYANTDGLGSFGPQQIITTANDVQTVSAADLDGDGDLDVLFAARGGVTWYENTDGLGTFVFRATSGSGSACEARAEDLDRDGDLDLLSAFCGPSKVTWYENVDGLGSFGSEQIISTDVLTAAGVFAADLDHDKDLDVLATSFEGGKIAWYRNSLPDCNENGITDTCDIADGRSEDCNGNLTPDECELSSGTSEDCDFDGVLDECQPDDDCNANGALDTCDIAEGTSDDCGGNGIPDECDLDCNNNAVSDNCDIFTGTSADCNDNGVPDECDNDCNSNNVPDACDIADGTSPDVDGDGIPDECGFSIPEMVVDATGEALTNRYLMFEAPRPAVIAGTIPEVVRIRVIALDGFAVPDPDVLYVGPPHSAPEENVAQPGSSFTVAPMQCDVYAHPWDDARVVAAYGAEIMPNSTYELQRTFATCPYLTEQGCWSPPISITTATCGDVAELYDGPGSPPQPDFNDITALVRKFVAASDAPLKSVAQLQPNVVFPLRPIDFRDIAVCVSAFEDTPYADMPGISGPCACPSTVTCDATPCVADLDCGNGYCIDNFCTDACGRCSP